MGRVKYRVKAAYVIINFVINSTGSPRMLARYSKARLARYSDISMDKQVNNSVARIRVIKIARIIIGASLSEPHIDEFAVNFLYIYISVVRRAVSHFLLLFCVCQLISVAVSHFRLLFCAFLLRHALFRKRLEPRVVFSEGTKNSHTDGWTAR